MLIIQLFYKNFFVIRRYNEEKKIRKVFVMLEYNEEKE